MPSAARVGVAWPLESNETRDPETLPQDLLPLDAIEPDDHRFGGKAAGLVRLLSFAPDGRTLATIGLDGVVRLWRAGQRRKPPATSAGAR